ncbi:MAG: hypothetical protein AAFX00_08925 [Pseudomonadota bacterium]
MRVQDFADIGQFDCSADGGAVFIEERGLGFPRLAPPGNRSFNVNSNISAIGRCCDGYGARGIPVQFGRLIRQEFASIRREAVEAKRMTILSIYSGCKGEITICALHKTDTAEAGQYGPTDFLRRGVARALQKPIVPADHEYETAGRQASDFFYFPRIRPVENTWCQTHQTQPQLVHIETGVTTNAMLFPQ